MLSIMCTRNLWRVIGGTSALPARSPYTPTSTRLASWCVREVETPAGLIGVGLEETTYLTVVFPLAKLPDFIPVFATAVGEALLDLSVPIRTANREAAAIAATGYVARNDNRSLMGSVNDVAWHTWVGLEESGVTPQAMREVQRRLNEMPHVKRDPSIPVAAVRLLFAEGASAQ
jgi:hypothetical protein